MDTKLNEELLKNVIPELLNKEKIVYNIRDKSQDQVREILNMEIFYLLKENPGYRFKQFDGNGEFNNDGSRTYKIILQKERTNDNH